MSRALLGALLALLLAGAVGAETQRERSWKCAQDCLVRMALFSTKLDEFHRRTGRYPASLAELGAPVPMCPSAMSPTYSYYRSGGGYVLYCAGANHLQAGLQANQPRAEVSGPGIGRTKVTPPELDRRPDPPVWEPPDDTPPPGSAALQGCEANLKRLGEAVEMYSTDAMGRYPKRLSQLPPHYIQELPKCPSARRDTYSASFKSWTKPDRYRFYCKGHQHGRDGVPANFPAYDSEVGLHREPLR